MFTLVHSREYKDSPTPGIAACIAERLPQPGFTFKAETNRFGVQYVGCIALLSSKPSLFQVECFHSGIQDRLSEPSYAALAPIALLVSFAPAPYSCPNRSHHQQPSTQKYTHLPSVLKRTIMLYRPRAWQTCRASLLRMCWVRCICISQHIISRLSATYEAPARATARQTPGLNLTMKSR
jgi:hypothetical protein